MVWFLLGMFLGVVLGKVVFEKPALYFEEGALIDDLDETDGNE